jgi:hypothetical protein
VAVRRKVVCSRNREREDRIYWNVDGAMGKELVADRRRMVDQRSEWERRGRSLGLVDQKTNCLGVDAIVVFAVAWRFIVLCWLDFVD